MHRITIVWEQGHRNSTNIRSRNNREIGNKILAFRCITAERAGWLADLLTRGIKGRGPSENVVIHVAGEIISPRQNGK